MGLGATAIDIDELTPEEIMLVDEWLSNGFNMLEAHKTLFPHQSEKNHRNVYKIFAQPAVKKFAEEQVKLRGMGKHEALANLAAKARGNITEFLNPDGSFDMQKIRNDKSGQVKKIKTTVRTSRNGETTEETSIEFYDAIRATELLLKAQGDLVEKTEVTGADGATLGMIITRNVVGGFLNADGEPPGSAT